MDSNNKNRKTYSGSAFWNNPDTGESLPEIKQTPDVGTEAQILEPIKSVEQLQANPIGEIHPVITKDKKTAIPPQKAIVIIAAAAAVIILGTVFAVIAVNMSSKPNTKQPANQVEAHTTGHASKPEAAVEAAEGITSADSVTSEEKPANEQQGSQEDPETANQPRQIGAQVEYETQKREIKRATYFVSASASSVLPDQAGHNYSASNVLRNNGTCWSEGASGYGKGEWIRLNLPELQKVSGLRIINGYAGTDKQYDYNSKITDATITFSDGSSANITLNVFNTSERKTIQTVRFSEPIETEFVRITIHGVAPGDCEDTCLTFVEPF